MTHVIAVVKSSMTAYPEVDALPMVRSCLTAQRLQTQVDGLSASLTCAARGPETASWEITLVKSFTPDEHR
jgi:hypothetical protein